VAGGLDSALAGAERFVAETQPPEPPP
jgi:hypothetical protein